MLKAETIQATEVEVSGVKLRPELPPITLLMTKLGTSSSEADTGREKGALPYSQPPRWTTQQPSASARHPRSLVELLIRGSRFNLHERKWGGSRI